MARHAGTPSILWTDRPGQSRAADAVQPTIPCARSQPHSPSRAAIGRVTLALAGLPRPGHAAHDKGAGTEFVAISEWLRLRASLPRRMNGRSPWRREVHLSDTKTPAAANRQPCEPHIGDGLQPCLLACASSRSARRAIKSTEINTKTLAYSLYMPVELRIPIQKLSGLKSKPTKSLAMVVYGVHSYVRHSWTQTAIKCLDCAPWVIISFKAKQRRVVYWKRQAQFVVTMLKCVCGGGIITRIQTQREAYEAVNPRNIALQDHVSTDLAIFSSSRSLGSTCRLVSYISCTSPAEFMFVRI